MSMTAITQTNEFGKSRKPSSGELRRSPRVSLLLRVAKLVVDERELPCIIRDVSATGLKARIFQPLPAHSSMQVEVSCGERHRVELVWTANDHAGFRFTEEVDVRWLVDDACGSFRKRQVRLNVALNAKIHARGEGVDVSVTNISQQGAAIECDITLMIDELIRFQAEGAAEIYAKVRWRRHPQFGLVFEQPFQLDELAKLLSMPPANGIR